MNKPCTTESYDEESTRHRDRRPGPARRHLGRRTAAPAKSAKANANIVQTAVAAGQFKTLVALVKQAGLAGALSGKGPLTVFAPTDAAFAKVPKATLAALGKDKAKLKAVLLYHVVKGKVTAAQVVKLKSATTLEGSPSPSRSRAARSSSAARRS